jgi:hypothetical protein
MANAKQKHATNPKNRFFPRMLPIIQVRPRTSITKLADSKRIAE